MCWSVYWDQTEELWSNLWNLDSGKSNKDLKVKKRKKLGFPFLLSFIF